MVSVLCMFRQTQKVDERKWRETPRRIRAYTRNVPGAFLSAGVIPASIGGLSNLQTLELQVNALTGPSSHCVVLNQCLHKEEQREAGRKSNGTHTRNVPRACLCPGAIPASIGGLSSLQTLDLRQNRLSGT